MELRVKIKKSVWWVILLLLASHNLYAGVIFFEDNELEFNTNVTGSVSLGVENFESSTLVPGAIAVISDPISQNIANGPFPSGLSIPVIIQANTLGGVPTTTSSRGDNNSLLVGSAGDPFGHASDVISTNFSSDSLDLIFSSSDMITGISFNVLTVSPSDRLLDVRVYDVNNVLLGMDDVLGNSFATHFLGIIATPGDTIGRINIFNVAGADNIELFAKSSTVTLPSTLSIFTLGLIAIIGFKRSTTNSKCNVEMFL